MPPTIPARNIGCRAPSPRVQRGGSGTSSLSCRLAFDTMKQVCSSLCYSIPFRHREEGTTLLIMPPSIPRLRVCVPEGYLHPSVAQNMRRRVCFDSTTVVMYYIAFLYNLIKILHLKLVVAGVGFGGCRCRKTPGLPVWFIGNDLDEQYCYNIGIRRYLAQGPLQEHWHIKNQPENAA